MFPQSFLYVAIGIYILSMGLASIASTGRGPICLSLSKGGYLVATGLIGSLLISRLVANQTWMITGFENGFLLSIVILGVVYVFAEIMFSLSFGPIVLGGVSLVLSILAIVFNRELAVVDHIGFFLGGHTFLVFIALAAFSLSFIFSLLYLMEAYFIKEKAFRPLLFRLPSLELTNRLNDVALWVGTIAFAGGFLKGLIVLQRDNPGTTLLSDPTYFLSGLVLVLYAALIVWKQKLLEGRTRLAYASIFVYIVFLCVVCLAHSTSA
ncbi:hypothetical protein IIB34_08970 [PVC group bacterium]|nr:hypothetical protein [PVC group bacterium]